VGETPSIAVLDTGRALRFPRECPRCGSDADTRVRVTKIFARRTARAVVWIHYHVDVFACAACVREHELIVRPDPLVVSEATRRHATQGLPIMLAGASVLGSGVLLASVGVTAASRRTSAIGSASIAALGLGIAGTGLGLMAGGWLAHRAIVCPADWPDAQYAVDVRSWLGARAIISAPATALARAVDFSDDRSSADEPAWRTFVFERASYAQEFARLNARSVCDRQRPVRRMMLRDRRALVYAAAAALVAGAIWWWDGR
jgi:hypothetical protein